MEVVIEANSKLTVLLILKVISLFYASQFKSEVMFSILSNKIQRHIDKECVQEVRCL